MKKTLIISSLLLYHNKEYIGAGLWYLDSPYKIMDRKTMTHMKFVRDMITHNKKDIINAHNIGKHITGINSHHIVYPNNDDRITNCGMIANAIPLLIGSYPVSNGMGMPKSLEHDIYIFEKTKKNWLKSGGFGHAWTFIKVADDHWTIIEGSQGSQTYHKSLLSSKIYTNSEIHYILEQYKTEKINPLSSKTSIFDFNTTRYISYKKIN